MPTQHRRDDDTLTSREHAAAEPCLIEDLEAAPSPRISPPATHDASRRAACAFTARRHAANDDAQN